MDKLATQLLNVFGYVNAKEEDVIVLNSSFNYLQVEFLSKYIISQETKNTWVMELE